ncbi:MAG: hypothetical protein QOC89_4948 [Paraburkholderia sp.]|jgi:hypothetical protein|nr:hypothetical protein [Paraburkholderia sp.]
MKQLSDSVPARDRTAKSALTTHSIAARDGGKDTQDGRVALQRGNP